MPGAFPFAFGGFVAISGLMYVVIPAIFHGVTGERMAGFQQDRDGDLIPLLLIGGGIGIILYFGSYYLRQRVERDEAQVRTKSTPSDALAAALKLSLETDPVGKHKVLTGRRGEVWLAVHLKRRQTRIVARHGLRLPKGTLIQAGKQKGDRFGNVLLDRALMATGLDAFQVDWTHPRTMALMLELLQQHPGSTIDARNITIQGKLNTADLDGLLDSVVALAALLKAPPAPSERKPFPGR
jgi:hypothetical protein